MKSSYTRNHVWVWAVCVSLPREWFQEIKCMMPVHSIHGLLLTCTQESCLYLNHVQLIDIYTMYRKLLSNPLQKKIKNPNLLGEPVSCPWWRIPIHSGPLSGSNWPTLWLLPFSPLSYPSAHITLFTTTTSTITVFFGWDSLYVWKYIQYSQVNVISCTWVRGAEANWLTDSSGSSRHLQIMEKFTICNSCCGGNATSIHFLDTQFSRGLLCCQNPSHPSL